MCDHKVVKTIDEYESKGIHYKRHWCANCGAIKQVHEGFNQGGSTKWTEPEFLHLDTSVMRPIQIENHPPMSIEYFSVEDIWMKAWSAATAVASGPVDAVKVADHCLAEFKSRFRNNP